MARSYVTMRWSEEFGDACFQDQSRFEMPNPRRRIQNFASASVKRQMSSNSKVPEMHGTRYMSGRLLFISTMDKIDLGYPLTPVPLSLPHDDGSMNTTDKSKLMHEIESYLEDSTAPTDLDVCNISSTYTEESSPDIWSTSSGTAEPAYLDCTASTPCMSITHLLSKMLKDNDVGLMTWYLV